MKRFAVAAALACASRSSPAQAPAATPPRPSRQAQVRSQARVPGPPRACSRTTAARHSSASSRTYKDCMKAYVADRKTAMQGQRGRGQRRHQRLQRADEEDQRGAGRREGRSIPGDRRLGRFYFTTDLSWPKRILRSSSVRMPRAASGFTSLRARVGAHRSRAARGSPPASACRFGNSSMSWPWRSGMIHG